MEKHWVRPDSSESHKELLCIATFLPVRRWRSVIPFLRMSFKVEKQIRQSSGLVRYGLRTNLPRKQFWTLSVWADRKATMSFVSAEPHQTAVRNFERWAGAGAAFVEWTTGDAGFSWKTALEKLKNPTFYYKPE